MQAPARPAAMQLTMREMADPGRAAHVVVEEFIRPMADRLRGIVRELMPDAPEEQTLMVGFSVIGQLLYYRQNRPISEILFGRDAIGALSAEAVGAHVARFTLAALGREAPIHCPESARPESRVAEGAEPTRDSGRADSRLDRRSP